jgi:hypothetical protein
MDGYLRNVSIAGDEFDSNKEVAATNTSILDEMTALR